MNFEGPQLAGHCYSCSDQAKLTHDVTLIYCQLDERSRISLSSVLPCVFPFIREEP
jgi:hypothetical protein